MDFVEAKFSSILVTEDMLCEIDDMNAQAKSPAVRIPGINRIIPLVLIKEHDVFGTSGETFEEMRDRLVESANKQIETDCRQIWMRYYDANKKEPKLCILAVKEMLRLDICKNDITVWAEVGYGCFGEFPEEFDIWYNGCKTQGGA